MNLICIIMDVNVFHSSLSHRRSKANVLITVTISVDSMSSCVVKVAVFFCVLKILCSGSFAYECGPLFLTVSASGRKLVLNWDFQCEYPPDSVILFDKETNSTLQRIPASERQGSHQTDHTFNYNIFLPGNWHKNAYYPEVGPHCFKYFIISLRNDQRVDEKCLKIEPTWMEHFGSSSLSDLLIPGTHDSGAFVTGSYTKFVKRLVLTQRNDIWFQLVSGIRYFDLRIGYHGDTFYIYHGIARCAKLVPELMSVREFLGKSSKEVVILDFHSFDHPKPFTHDLHGKLQIILWDLFGDITYVLPKYISRVNVKLEEMWRRNKRLIMNYNDGQQVREVPWLWNGLRRDWGNVRKTEQLLSYINLLTHRSRDDQLHVLMAELTLDESDVLSFFSSLKKLADMVNPILNRIFRENSLAFKFNVIATDFYMGNDIVNIAIETNSAKLARDFYN